MAKQARPAPPEQSASASPVRRRRQIILLAVITAIAALSAPLYGLLFLPGGTWDQALYGLPHFAIGGFLTAAVLIFVLPTRLGAPIRRLAYLPRVAIYAAGLVVIIGLAGFGGQSIVEGRLAFEAAFTPNVTLYLFVGAMTLIISTIAEFVELTGPRIILAVITGRYSRPRREDRVFLFIDVVGSTALAERLGAEQTQSMLSRLFFDIGEPVARYRGEIHAYVGDEVIITWPAKRGIEEGRCVACFFAIDAMLTHQARAYERTFGTAPRVRGALHGGEVVMAQVGDAKKAIVYFGDTMNIAARLEDYAKHARKRCVISRALLDRISLPQGIAAQPVGPVELRGRAEPTDVAALAWREADDDSAPAKSAERAGGASDEAPPRAD